MTTANTKNRSDKDNYHGRILNGNYTAALKNRIMECRNALLLIENTGTPTMLYVAAWQEENKNIWYEYACRKISTLLECEPGDTAHAFCKSVIERRIYKYGGIDRDKNIEKEHIPQNSLNCERDLLRSESVSSGVTEAIYKIGLKDRQYIWLNDKANIEWYEQDKIYLSIGSLTDVTKEMKSEEEQDKLMAQLQEALKKVKILSGLIPICASCKQIRDDQGFWNHIEDYISQHSDAQFSHGICPDCAKKLYPEFF